MQTKSTGAVNKKEGHSNTSTAFWTTYLLRYDNRSNVLNLLSWIFRSDGWRRELDENFNTSEVLWHL